MFSEFIYIYIVHEFIRWTMSIQEELINFLDYLLPLKFFTPS